MALRVTDPDLESRLITSRQNSGADRYDEVWEGLYVMAPLATNEHQDIQGDFVAALKDVLGWEKPARICAGVNVSDRGEGWIQNYRCPDVVVFLPGNPAIDHKTHWEGGPDFLVEIASTGDRSEEKRPFYASVGVREMLVINRNPWRLELYSAAGQPGTLSLVGTAALEAGPELRSTVLPLTFQLVSAAPRPRIKLALTQSSEVTDSGRTSWLI